MSTNPLSARDALTSAAARLDAAARTADNPESAALYREARDSLWGLIWAKEGPDKPQPEICCFCVGSGKIGLVVCPICHGTGDKHRRGLGDTHLRPSDPANERHMPTWVSRGAL
jgi:hypothetical protein